MWSGSISFGLVNIPVKLYAAVSRKSVRFNQIDRNTGARIKYKKVSAESGDEVTTDDIVKGYELATGDYVTVSDDELAQLDPKASRTIDIEEFVDLADIDPVFYDSAYLLAPDKATTKPYALLARAMEQSGKVGIARVVMRTKQYLCAVRPKDGKLRDVDDGLCRRGQRPGPDPRARPARRHRGLRQGAGDGQPAHRVAQRHLRPGQVRGHVPRQGARGHRAQGRRRGGRDRHARAAGGEGRRPHGRPRGVGRRRQGGPGPASHRSRARHGVRRGDRRRRGVGRRGRWRGPRDRSARRAGRPAPQGQQPREGAVPRDRVHEGRGHRLLRPHRAGDAAPHRGAGGSR